MHYDARLVRDFLDTGIKLRTRHFLLLLLPRNGIHGEGVIDISCQPMSPSLMKKDAAAVPRERERCRWVGEGKSHDEENNVQSREKVLVRGCEKFLPALV